MATSASEQATTEASHVPLSAPTGPSPASSESTNPAQRHSMIAEAAFFMAQARGFTPSQELDDWLSAEREVDERLSNPNL